jgi:hypothetical protein
MLEELDSNNDESAGADPLLAVKSMEALAAYHLAKEDPAEAEALYRHSVQVARQCRDWSMISDATLELADFLLDGGRPAEARDLLTEVIDEYLVQLKQPRNLRAVLNPDAMLFEMMKDDYRESGELPFGLQTMMVTRSSASHELGHDDGIPTGLPSTSNFELRMLTGVELGDAYNRLASALHVLGSECDRASAFELAERYYRLAAAAAEEEVELAPEIIENFRSMVQDNLTELYEDQGRDPLEANL